MRSPRFVGNATADLQFLKFPAVFEKSVEARCLNCQAELTLHQPDMDLPERLLGVCESCKHWYLIDLVREVNEGVMVWLPDNEVIRELSRENPPAGISIMSHDPGVGLPALPGTSDERRSSP